MSEMVSDDRLYEPPRIEAVLGAGDLQDESMYAGPAISVP